MPKISIIMPVYNKRSYLRRSLDSVLDQDFSDYELIAVDDGSTDESPKILDEYAAKDPRIKAIHTENHGVSHARNVGLKNVSGDYITFVDADDEINKEYLSSLYKTLIDSEADIAIQGLTKVYPDGHKEDVGCVFPSGTHEMTGLLSCFADLQKKTGIFGYCVSKLFPASLTEGVFFDEKLKLAEDFDYYLKLYKKTKTVCFDNRSHYLYYQNLAGSSVDVKDEDIDYFSQFTINLRYREFLKDMNAYTESNKEILDQMLSSSAYHMLLYSNKEDYSKFCQFIRDNLNDSFSHQRNRLQKGVLEAVLDGRDHKAQVLIKAYKTARSVKGLFR